MGSENVVLWGKDNIYLIKTLREFVYMDDDGKDQGVNVRAKAKDITALLQDDERLRAERKNRSYMATRLEGDDPQPIRPQRTGGSSRTKTRTADNEEQDPELRRALEESKRQAELDARKRRGKPGEEDDDLARALKLSEEEEEARRRRLEQDREADLFDGSNDQQQPIYNPYQQQQQVDFFGNPIQNDMSMQNTGYLQNAYSQVQQPQQTGLYYQNTGGYYPRQSQFDDYGGGAHDLLTAQNTGMNAATKIERQQTGRKNPYAQNAAPQPQPVAQRIEPVKTGSNNPFAQFGNQPQVVQKPYQPPTLNDIDSQRQSQPAFAQYQQHQALKPQRTRDDGRHADLAALIGAGTGTDTFGNTGDLRLAAHHTANPVFMNSGGVSAAGAISQQQTGHNPFIQAQRTGAGSAPVQQQSYTGNRAYIGTQQTGGFAYPGQQAQQGQNGGYAQQQNYGYPPHPQQQQQQQYGGYGSNQDSLIDL